MNNFADTSLVYFKSKDEDTLEALAFYEGSHIDSQGKAHVVPPETIQALADKTNDLLTQTDIPILIEHGKNGNIKGVIKENNSFVARPIDSNDVSRNPKLSSALGKLGLFVSNIKLADDDLLNNIKNGIGKTISCGIDFKNQLIREISLVAVNALPLASIFNNGQELTYLIADTKSNKINNFNMETTAVTLEEALQTNEDTEQLKSEAIELLCTLLAVIDNIAAMSDEDLGVQQVASKEELYQAQMESFLMMLDEKVNPFTSAEMEQQPPTDPRMQPQQAQYSYPLAITTFDEMDQYVSEYGLGSSIKSAVGGIGKKLATTGIGKKVLGSGLGGTLKTGIKTAKTGIANTTMGGLNKVGSLGNKLAVKPGVLGKVAGGIQKRSASLADKIGKRRLARYSTNSKLSRFVK